MERHADVLSDPRGFKCQSLTSAESREIFFTCKAFSLLLLQRVCRSRSESEFIKSSPLFQVLVRQVQVTSSHVSEAHMGFRDKGFKSEGKFRLSAVPKIHPSPCHH